MSDKTDDDAKKMYYNALEVWKFFILHFTQSNGVCSGKALLDKIIVITVMPLIRQSNTKCFTLKTNKKSKKLCCTKTIRGLQVQCLIIF